jgi:hypothetical protein
MPRAVTSAPPSLVTVPPITASLVLVKVWFNDTRNICYDGGGNRGLIKEADKVVREMTHPGFN